MTLRLPRLGETMEEARVTAWLVEPGAPFRRGDVLLEVETDKTAVEVPALADGTLVEALVAPGDTVALDQAIARVEQEGAADEVDEAEPGADHGPSGPRSEAANATPAATPDVRERAAPAASSGARAAASPAARAAARKAGIGLEAVHGTGRRGRITAEDVRARAAAEAGRADPRAGTGRPGRIAVHRRGEGAAVALFHGLFDDARGWRMIPGRLKAAGCESLAFDLPGHGESGAAAASFDEAAALLHDALVREVPKGPVRLAGHSLGAALAVRIAGRLGARAAGLALIAPAGLGPRISSEFIDGMIAARSAPALARAVGLLDGGPLSAAAMEEEARRHARGLEDRARLAQAVASGGFQQIDLRAEVAALGCPVSCLWGTGDRVLDWRDAASLPARARVHLVPGAGHLPHHAEPALAADLIAGR